MDNAQQIVYGDSGFPRTVARASDGNLQQFFVHSEGEFDVFFERNRSDENLYSSICRFRSDLRPIVPNFPFDLDSPMKDSAFGDETDREKIRKMREDEQLAEDVLGGVWSDAQSLVKKCKEDGVPVVSVFSGLGVHCHLLFQEQVDPKKEKVSTSNYYIDECDLVTYDRKIITDTRRVLRIPNSQRVGSESSSGVWCIPITEDEVLNNSLHDLLERCSSPKDIPYHERYRPENRPEMEIKEGYIESNTETVGTEPIDKNAGVELSDGMEEMVKDCLKLPCIRERFFSSNPHHMVRFNGVILLYQAGFNPKEVRQIIERIGWIDYDSDVTYKQTEQIWKRRYSEGKCETLKSLGLCVFGPMFDEYSDEPKDCETYDYKSGEALYPYES
jgi:hypothetical protein